VHALLAEGRVAEVWARLAAAEGAGCTRRVLDDLERAYRAELATYQRALAREPTREQDTW
jgi:hypothetical protein